MDKSKAAGAPTKPKKTLSTIAEAYRDWVETGCKLPGKSQKGLSLAISRPESTVSKMCDGTRLVHLDEVDNIADYFGPDHPPPNGRGQRQARSAALTGDEEVPPGLAIDAIVAPGFWRGVGAVVDTTATRMPIPGRLEPKFAHVKQYACAFQADPTKFAICVPYAALRTAPLQDDEVHVRRTRANGEIEDTVRIVKITGNKVRLILEEASDKDKDRSLAYPSKRAGEQIEIRGLVIGTFFAKSV